MSSVPAPGENPWIDDLRGAWRTQDGGESLPGAATHAGLEPAAQGGSRTDLGGRPAVDMVLRTYPVKDAMKALGDRIAHYEMWRLAGVDDTVSIHSYREAIEVAMTLRAAIDLRAGTPQDVRAAALEDAAKIADKYSGIDGNPLLNSWEKSTARTIAEDIRALGTSDTSDAELKRTLPNVVDEGNYVPFSERMRGGTSPQQQEGK